LVNCPVHGSESGYLWQNGCLLGARCLDCCTDSDVLAACSKVLDEIQLKERMEALTKIGIQSDPWFQQWCATRKPILSSNSDKVTLYYTKATKSGGTGGKPVKLVLRDDRKQTAKKCVMHISETPGYIYVDFWIGKRDYSLTFDKKRKRWALTLAPGVHQRVTTQKTRLLLQELLTHEHERTIKKAWQTSDSQIEKSSKAFTVLPVNVFRCFAFNEAGESAIAKARHLSFAEASRQVKRWFHMLEGCQRVVIKDFKGRTWEGVAEHYQPEIF